jgi:replicative DNA helicase
VISEGKVVLAGVLPDRLDVLTWCLPQLSEEHFQVPVERALWRLIVRFYEVSGGVLTERFLERLEEQSPAKVVALREVYRECAQARVTAAEVRAAVALLRERKAHRETAEALTEAMDVLLHGGKVGVQEVPPGPGSAWRVLLSRWSEVSRSLSSEAAPEGEVFSKTGFAEYLRRKERASRGVSGVLTGVSEVDRLTGGLQPGELMLVVGYTGAGKSMFCAQLAWHASVVQRKNVFYATSETTREVTARRLYARHSRLERFGLPQGLDTAEMRKGTLDPHQEEVLRQVVEDLEEGRASGRYGRVYVAQVPPGATWGYVQAAAQRVASRWQIDLIVIDYLALLRADRKRENVTAEFADMLKDVKVFATSFGDEGVVVVSPWSVQQPAFKQALERREYTLANLSDTSEAEKSPDVLFWLLSVPDQPRRVRAGLLKNRDGSVGVPFELEADYRSAYFGDVQSVRLDDLYRTSIGGG